MTWNIDPPQIGTWTEDFGTNMSLDSQHLTLANGQDWRIFDHLGDEMMIVNAASSQGKVTFEQGINLGSFLNPDFTYHNTSYSSIHFDSGQAIALGIPSTGTKGLTLYHDLGTNVGHVQVDEASTQLEIGTIGNRTVTIGGVTSEVEIGDNLTVEGDLTLTSGKFSGKFANIEQHGGSAISSSSTIVNFSALSTYFNPSAVLNGPVNVVLAPGTTTGDNAMISLQNSHSSSTSSIHLGKIGDASKRYVIAADCPNNQLLIGSDNDGTIANMDNAIKIDDTMRVTVGAGLQLGNDIIYASDGDTAITLDTSSNATIANNLYVGGDRVYFTDNHIYNAANGNLYFNMASMKSVQIQAASGNPAILGFGADDYEDDDDSWLLMAPDAGGDFLFQNYTTGTYVTSLAIGNTGNVAVAGDLTVTGNDIISSTATALTLSGANVEVKGGLTVTGNAILGSGGTAITFNAANDVTVAGDLILTSNNIHNSDDEICISLNASQEATLSGTALWLGAGATSGGSTLHKIGYGTSGAGSYLGHEYTTSTNSNGRFHLYDSLSILTNTPANILEIQTATTGTVAPGWGAGIEFQPEDDAGLLHELGSLSVIYSDVTSASRDGDFIITLASNSVLGEKFKVTSTGDVVIPGSVTAKTYKQETFFGYNTTVVGVMASGTEYYLSVGGNPFDFNTAVLGDAPSSFLVETALSDFTIERLAINFYTAQANLTSIEIRLKKYDGSGSMFDKTQWVTVGTAATVQGAGALVADTRVVQTPTDWAIEKNEIWGLTIEYTISTGTIVTQQINGGVLMLQDWNDIIVNA